MVVFRKKRKNQDGQASEFLLGKESSFSVQEAYKALRTNVTFSIPGSGAKCVGITSSGQGEGKSMNAVNLAVSFGQIGKKVLLIDCDMRLPTIASKIGIKGQPGLSNLLIGAGEPGKAIQPVEELGIHVLPAGMIPPDPTSLLESKQMRELLEQFRQEYDYIFVDLPPVNTVTDAVILSKYMDGFLLVVKHDSSRYRAVSLMVDQLRFADAKILGIIYANAAVSGRKYHKYYYSYGK